MAIRVQCPHCNKFVSVKDELAGKRIKCPGCGEGYRVETEEDDSESAAVPASRREEESPAPRRPRPKRARKKKQSAAALWLAGAGALVVAGVAVALLTRSRSDRTDNPQPGQPSNASVNTLTQGVPSNATPAPPPAPPAAKTYPLLGEPYVTLVAYSPDGKQLATTQRDLYARDALGTVKLWDLASGKDQKVLTGHKTPADQIAFSPDGQWLVSTAAEELILWNLSTGKVRHTVQEPGLKPGAGGLGFTADNKTVTAAHRKGIYLLDVASGTSRVHPLPLSGFSTFACSPSASVMAVTLIDVRQSKAFVQLVDLAAGRNANLLPAGDIAQSMTYCRDGKFLALALASSVEIHEIGRDDKPMTLTGANRYGKMQMSPDGACLIGLPMIAGKPQAELWDLRSKQRREVQAGWCAGFDFAPDGKTVALAVHGGTVQFIDPATGGEKKPSAP